MVNEEDHLRLQALRSGSRWRRRTREVGPAGRRTGPTTCRSRFTPSSVFLPPARPTSGTGLRASVLIHLPGLVLTKEIGRCCRAWQQVGLTFRGLYGEGSEVVGNFFQISNQTTLGSPRTSCWTTWARGPAGDRARGAGAAGSAARRAGDIIEDKLWRAYGHAAVRPEPDVRRGDELPERRAAGRRAETDPRPQCIYPQQAPDLFAAGAPRRTRRGER